MVAATDYVRAWPQLIAEYVDAPYVTLGTDGFGLSDTRGALRRHFKVDAESITLRALQMLADRGEVDASTPKAAFDRYAVGDVRAADPSVGQGDA